MKYILVTGAYGGMGRKTAEALAEKGYTVFALDCKTESPQKNMIPIKADLTDDASIRQAVQSVRAVTDTLFAIIHFAGIYMLDSLAEMDSESFERIFRINVFGAFLINKAFLPFLKKGSRILMTTSELAPLDPLPFTGIYAVTKSALDKYAYSLRMELQLLDIEVSVLRAGAVDTGMLGVSTQALDRFCENTTLYSCNAKRFKAIVESVESRCIDPEKIARKTVEILHKKHTKFAYSINRNPLLLTLDVLPKQLQLSIIKKILK